MWLLTEEIFPSILFLMEAPEWIYVSTGNWFDTQKIIQSYYRVHIRFSRSLKRSPKLFNGKPSPINNHHWLRFIVSLLLSSNRFELIFLLLVVIYSLTTVNKCFLDNFVRLWILQFSTLFCSNKKKCWGIKMRVYVTYYHRYSKYHCK